jgi:hypothetical protein
MTATFNAPGAGTFQPLVNGSGFGRAGLQAVSWVTSHVYIGQSAPAENTQDYIELSMSGTRELVVDLAASDIVYFRAGLTTTPVVRGWKETRP